MSGRGNSYAAWTPSDLEPWLGAMIARVGDLTPVMQVISFEARDEARGRLASGSAEYPWPPHAETTNKKWGPHPLGVGEHGGFSSGILAFFGKHNAGWKSRASHAHLFDLGTLRHYTGGKRTNIYSSGKTKGRRAGHLSRAETRRRIQTSTSLVHQPARSFAYISEELKSTAMDQVANYVLSEDTNP